MNVTDPIILPKNIARNDLSIVRLPHPRHSLPSLYAISHEDDGEMYELQSVGSSTEGRCWFLQTDVEDQIISNNSGRLLLATTFDPFFLLLNLFSSHDHKDQSKYEQLDVLLDSLLDHWKFESNSSNKPISNDLQEFHKFIYNNDNSLLLRVCDVIEGDLWRFSENKVTLEIENIINKLINSGPHLNKIWDRLGINEGRGGEENLEIQKLIDRKISFDLISTYLPPKFVNLMKERNPDYRFERLIEHQTRVGRGKLLGSAEEFVGRRPASEPIEMGSRLVKKVKKTKVEGRMKTLGEMWGVGGSKKMKEKDGEI
ncbi:hypothetical protein CROQUDRAFT_662399 [Cronartium quercuum f. sp. fusiforme G11]|uniref:Ribonuclease H2 subunit B n=1 Tax=Cronartium quercuum f. sp. fusiforme G11 TaxID=708437 RepID=A0A9P6NBF9_9BASI|nr:hypothetical protein CROQUDRAFT_662399 [Cronartium quercuum f. sp. fusiforme G11]